MSLPEKLFKLKENGTTVRTEVIAGLTTFVTMAYIIFVNPAILSGAMGAENMGALTVATCLSAALATLIMGFWANYPIALAPGMGENVFFAVSVCVVMGMDWRQALAAIFISGIIFFILNFFKVREMIINGIPESMKRAIAVAIGMMIAFLGAQWCGYLTYSPVVYIQEASMISKHVVVASAGLIVMATLYCLNVRGALLIGMAVSTVLGIILGLVNIEGVVSAPPSIAPIFMQFDFSGVFTGKFIAVVLIFLFMDMFDTVGTLVGVSERIGLMKDGKLPRANRALMADAVGTVAGAAMGTSTVTSYIESCAGVKEGGRTGLTSIVAGIGFLLALFFTPIIGAVSKGVGIQVFKPFVDGSVAPVMDINLVYPAIGPVLIMIGLFMMKTVTDIKWSDPTEGLPAFLTILMLMTTMNIANGLAFGFLAYGLIKLLTGRGREVSPLMYILSLLSLLFMLRFWITG